MCKVALLLWTLSAVLLTISASHAPGSTCHYQEVEKRNAICRKNAGFVLRGSRTNLHKLKKACKDGRMQIYANCVKKNVHDCGISAKYDFEKQVELVGKICRRAGVLDGRTIDNCFDEERQRVEACEKKMQGSYAKYITANKKSSHDDKVICSLYGGSKKCLRDTFNPCSKNATEVLTMFVDAFAPAACAKFDSCLVCENAADTMKFSALLIGAILIFRHAFV